MKVGIIGLPDSGKSTICQALVQQGKEIVQNGQKRLMLPMQFTHYSIVANTSSPSRSSAFFIPAVLH